MDNERRKRLQRGSSEYNALMEQRQKDAEEALAERKRAEDAFRANYERLKAERLAREAK